MAQMMKNKKIHSTTHPRNKDNNINNNKNNKKVFPKDCEHKDCEQWENIKVLSTICTPTKTHPSFQSVTARKKFVIQASLRPEDGLVVCTIRDQKVFHFDLKSQKKSSKHFHAVCHQNIKQTKEFPDIIFTLIRTVVIRFT